MTEIRFYLDENINPQVGVQLARLGVTVITARELDKLGDTDIHHLKRATQMGYVLCTQDSDFLRLSMAGEYHAGIAFGKQFQATIGGWVRALHKLYQSKTAEDMVGHVEYLRVE